MKEPVELIKVKCFFELFNTADIKTAEGEALVTINENAVLISRKTSSKTSGAHNITYSSNNIYLKLYEISEIFPSEYKVRILTSGGIKIFISKLGYEFENFTRILINTRNLQLQEYLLMEEKLLKKDFKSQYKYFDDKNHFKSEGSCLISVFETALIILPDNYIVLRFPFSLIENIEKQQYKFIITLDDGKKIELFKMGYNFDPFIKIFSTAYENLILATQSYLKNIDESLSSLNLEKMSRLMLDGKPASRKEIEQFAPSFINKLEEKIIVTGLEKEYNFLKSIGKKDEIYFGLKQNLMGELAKDYFWFLVPFYGNNKWGNAIALEAFSISSDDNEIETDTETDLGKEEKNGKATYFFKILDDQEYKNFTNWDFITDEIPEIMKSISRALIKINFRREPIYMDEKKLLQKSDEKYIFAVKNIAELQFLRKRFIGRIFHTNFESWKKNAEKILGLNS